MKSIFIGSIIIVLLSVLFFTGCTKDDNPVTTDPSKASERVNQANQIMIPRLALLINSGGTDTSAMNMSAATALYEEALVADPSNTSAHFGVALTSVISGFGNPEMLALFSGTKVSAALPSPISKSIIPFSLKETKQPYGKEIQSAIRMNLDRFMKPDVPLGFMKPFMISENNHPPSHYQDLIETRILPVLAKAITHLKVVTTNPDFEFYIRPADIGDNIPDSIRFDLTEIYLLLGVCQMLDATASSMVAYNVDYDNSTSSAVTNAWQLNSPFMQLRSNGSQRMKDVRTNFIGAATTVQNGIAFLKNDAVHPGIQLIAYRPEDDAALNQIVAAMDSIKMVLSGPYTVPAENNQTITFNLVNFFDNAIANYKEKIPFYSVSSTQVGSNRYAAVLTWQATSFSNWIFPDPTFNNFLPGLTDATLKLKLGISGSNWAQFVVVGE